MDLDLCERDTRLEQVHGGTMPEVQGHTRDADRCVLAR